MTGDSNLALFTGRRHATFLAFARCVVPDEAPQAPGASSAATLTAAERFLADQDEATRARLRLLLRVFEWRAVLRFGKRFSSLSAEKQAAYLRAWQNSRLKLFRFGFSSLRNLVLISFYTRSESWAAIGYPGPGLETKAASP